VRAGVLEESRAAEDRYVFSHPLIREALYHGLTATRRARLHNQTLHYVARDGVRLAFEEVGASGPCIVATGISNCPAVRVRSLIATRRWERVSRTCRVLLYDRRGIGSSDAPEHGYSLRACVEDLRSVLFAAGAARAVIWGAADGGPLALAFAAAYPERTLGLILSGTSARLINGAGWDLGITDEAMAGLGPLEEIDKAAASSQMTHVRMTVSQEANAVSEMMRRVPQHAWTKIRGCFGASDVRGLLEGLRVPALILHDAGNRYIPVDAAHYLHEHIAGSRLLITDELAAPLLGDTIYGAIDTFVSSCAGAQGAVNR
jgi:pimeloyl-ACP methyl ester carboxylesterase